MKVLYKISDKYLHFEILITQLFTELCLRIDLYVRLCLADKRACPLKTSEAWLVQYEQKPYYR